MQRFKLETVIRLGIYLSLLAGFAAILSALLAAELITGIIIAMMVFLFASGLLFPILSRLAVEASTVAMGNKMAVFSSIMTFSGMLGTCYVSFLPASNILFTMPALLCICSVCAGICYIGAKK